MNFFEKMFAIDRRWVYLALGLAILISLLIPFSIPIPISEEAQNIYDYVDQLEPGQAIHLALDYDPSTLAELHPMTLAILKQCFANDVDVVITALHQFGPGMAAAAIDTAVARHDELTGEQMESGEDYVFLGYKPYPALIILGMGQNYRIPFPADYYGVMLDSLPMMQDIQNYDDVEAIINVSGTSATDWWIAYGQGRYNVPLAIGVTGVMATDYYPYLQTGQIFGILGGLKGAAEYETLVGTPGKAVDGMKVQIVAHLIIILFIVIGNIGYFSTRKRRGGAV
ncbi:MAG: hypothetical protein GF341_06465 [candidate division Zixibacteria bacterium]|nr:hypothetical protein [candidate division Zixibacteria bacterium]